jgi:hypothetical protein
MANNKNVSEIEQYAKQRGMRVVDPGRGRHIKIYSEGRVISTMSCTPSDGRSLKNVKSQIDRAVRERNSDVLTEAATAAPADVRPQARQRKRHGR